MRVPRPSIALIAGLLTAALWLISGALRMLSGSNVYVTRVISAIGISPLSTSSWAWPRFWAPLALLATCALLCSVVVLVVRLSRRPQSAIVVWFAVVVAGTVVGLSHDLLAVLTSIDDFGWRALAMAGVDTGMQGAYWGLAQGWIPALVVRRLARAESASVIVRARSAAVFSALALVLFLIVGVLGTQAWRAAIVIANAEAAGLSEENGAYPDPTAPGNPPPTSAPGSSPPQFSAHECSPENSMLLLGTADAGLGHRAQSIRLSNFSEEPCTVEGYIDIAVSDQNGNELAVDITAGSSYMATDPGAAPIEIPAHGEAVAYLAWDANSTAGALVVSTLFAAMLPGMERGSWPVDLDIIEGSPIEITAWDISTSAQP